MEPNNKDSALLANLATPTPKNKSPNSFAYIFGIVLPNFRQPFLSMKKSQKDALKMKIKDTVYSTCFSNPWLKDIGLGIFLSQSHSFFLILSSAFKALALIMALASLLKPEALKPDSSI